MKSVCVFLLVSVMIIGLVAADFGIDNEDGIFDNDRIWHMFVLVASTFKNVNCVWMGLYGVAMFNDNGIMAEKCYKLGLKGGLASFKGYKGVSRKEGKYLDPDCTIETCDELGHENS